LLKRIAVVGSGTSCIAFLSGLNYSKDIMVDVYDKGNDPISRIKAGDNKSLLWGFGGAGTFSDGKLSFSSDVGGNLKDIMPDLKSHTEFNSYAHKIALDLWGTNVDDNIEKTDCAMYSKLYPLFLSKGMNLIESLFVHLGTDVIQNRVLYWYNIFKNNSQIAFHFNTSVKEIKYNLKNNTIKVSTLVDSTDIGSTIEYDIIVIAIGRAGNVELPMIAVSEALNSRELYSNNILDIGIRYELPHAITSHITDMLYEFKAEYYTKTGERVRTFCVNPRGYVVEEKAEGYSLVNGHSYSSSATKSSNTNFAILVSHEFTTPFREAILYGKNIAKLSSMLSRGSCLVQRYTDFKLGRPSTLSIISKGFVEPTLKTALPGDLNLVLPRRIANNIEEFIEQLNKVIPGVANDSNLLYGIEAKFYSKKYQLSENMQLSSYPIYVIGDASGYTRGIMQSSISGIKVAEYVNKQNRVI